MLHYKHMFYRIFFLFFFILSINLFLLPLKVSAKNTWTLPIQILQTDGKVLSSFDIPIENDVGGADIAVADLGSDKIPEIIIGYGLGNDPLVRVLRQDGSEIGNFLAYDKTMKQGINITSCDLDGDQINEIITAPQYGAEPRLKVFSNLGKIKFDSKGYLAYSNLFRGGVSLDCGDIDHDGEYELITGAGPSGGPHVRIWKIKNNTLKLHDEFFAFDASQKNGIIVRVINSNDLLIASEEGPITHMVHYSFLNGEKTFSVLPSVNHATNGIIDIDILEKEIVLSPVSTNHLIRTTSSKTIATLNLFGATSFDVVDLDADGKEEIITVSGSPFFSQNKEKNIIIDISSQRLFAYENGRLKMGFPVSTGRFNSTPLGSHTVLSKVPFVHYAWTYGVNDPRNYDLGVVPYNLKFFNHIYIHYAPWHNNFGTPMSHGCVNVNLENMKSLYEWASEKISVEVKS